MHTRYAPVRHSHAPEGALTVRLACIRPAASVHPEPGSNSSLYYCLANCFSLNLGFRLDVLFGVPFKGSLPRAASRRRWSCAGLRLSMNFSLPFPSLNPSLSGKAGAKVQPFSKLTSTFLTFFSKIFHLADLQWEKFSDFTD